MESKNNVSYILIREGNEVLVNMFFNIVELENDVSHILVRKDEEALKLICSLYNEVEKWCEFHIH